MGADHSDHPAEDEEPDGPHHYEDPTEHMPLPMLGVRGAIGGVLMGLANLVPGISGGTMLLAAGVYPGFIRAIADVTTLKLRLRSLLLLGTIAGTAALGILLLAGVMRALVIEQRWVMYSLFIGLTLGGVPLVWRLARPATPGVFAGAAVAFAGMIAMQLGLGSGAAGGEASTPFLFLSGLAGASAMILPGVSGGYLLLLLGQYEVILGVVFGIVGVSNLLRWLLDRFEKPTLGALLGLLLGAVVGLWPFEAPVPPEVGDLIEGEVVTAETVDEIDIEDWNLVPFDPSAGQAAGALALVGLGIGATAGVARLGGSDDDEE